MKQFKQDFKLILENGGVKVEDSYIDSAVSFIQAKIKSEVDLKESEILASVAQKIEEGCEAKYEEIITESAEIIKSALASFDTITDEFITEQFDLKMGEMKTKLVESKEYEKMKAVLFGIKNLYKQSINEDLDAEDIEANLNESKSAELDKEIYSKVDKLTEQYNKIYKENVDLKADNESKERQLIFNGLMESKNVSEFDRDKLKEIIGHVQFKSNADFESSLTIMIESIAKKSTAADYVNDMNESGKKDEDKEEPAKYNTIW